MTAFLARCALLAATAGAVLAIGGCVMPQRLEPPKESLTAESVGLAGAAIEASSATWWTAYGDPQFDALVTKALERNTGLEQTLTRVRAAQAQLRLATGPLGPHVSFDGEEVRQRYSEHFIYPPPYGGGTYWQGALLTNLSWDLDIWGRQAAIVRSARASTFAAQLDVAASKLATAVALSQAYLDFNRAYALADIAQAAVEQRRKITSLVHKRIDAGLDTTVELREAEAAVPQAELARLQAEAARDLAVHRLAAIAGEGAGAYASLQRPQLNLEATLPVPTELPVNLLGRRPDVLAARARIDAASEQQAAARAAFYPNLNLRAFVGVQAIGLDHLLETSSRTYGAGPAISLPLFESVRLKGEYQLAAVEQDRAIADYNDVVVRAVQDVADQLTQVASSAQQLEQARASLASAEQAYRLAQRRYESGLANYLAVLMTETRVLDARTSYVEVLHAQAFARVSLLLAAGGSFTSPAA